MKKTILAAAALVATAASAFAADLPARPYTKAPPPVVSPATNWSGFYIGAMGGYGWSDRVRASVGGLGVTVNSDSLNGGFAGGTIGYNWQMPGSQFVWGLEVDAAWSDIKYSETAFGVTFEDRIQAFGSVTGRLGMAFNSVLLYAKGGYAWASNKISVSGFGLTASESQVHSGWTVGAGLEWMFAPAWSLKGEYMYADYGSKAYAANVVPGGVHIGATVHTAKVGVNFHF